MEVIQGFRDITSTTLTEWVNTWLIEYKKPFVKDYTYYEICRYTRYIKTSNLGQMALDEIKSTDIQKFLNTYPKSRKKELLSTYLKAIFEKAYNLELIDRNPVKAITMDRQNIKNY